MPRNGKERVRSLFKDLEKEFEAVYAENIRLRDKIAELESRGGCSEAVEETNNDHEDKNNVLRHFTKNTASKTRYKLKAHTSKIVSSFKTSSVSGSLVGEYKGHRDGLWDIDVSNLGHPLIGTASADKTARIWSIDTGKCLMSYAGHGGSVNGLAFHPAQDLVLTASGDGSAHVWKAQAATHVSDHSFHASSANGGYYNSSEDSGGESSGQDDPAQSGYNPSTRVVKSPNLTFSGHSGVVIACDWFCEDVAVTASWDRTANLYDAATGTPLQTLVGHDDQLNDVNCHPRKRLIATCSRDTTFRLWDFRETIHSVSVFQGHTDSVTCAVFARADQIVSGSDDRSVKVWDLRNMRAPVVSIETASPVNRLSVSSSGVIAIPHDNRHVVLYDLNASGQKLLRLPRESSKSHHRMVTAARWTERFDQWKCKTNLFTCGFDRMALGWWIKGISKEELSAGGGGSGNAGHKPKTESKTNANGAAASKGLDAH